jgi:hypothetical protein
MKIETFPGIISDVKFGEFQLINFPIALIDLKHVNNIYHEFTSFKIAGLLGSDILVKYKAEINLKKMVLKLYK